LKNTWLNPNEIRHDNNSRRPIVLFLCMFCLILYKTAYSVFEIFTPPFLWLLKCSKKNLRKWTWKQEKMTKIFGFQPILDCYATLESLEKFILKKLIDKLIVLSINRFFLNFLSIFIILARKSCLSKFKSPIFVVAAS
jgi:hypothetical protein